MDIVGGTVQEIHIDRFAHLILIQGGVAEGHDIALRLRDSPRLTQPVFIVRFLLPDIPHLQKHQGKAPYRRAFQHDRRVLPVAKPFNAVDILIRKIDAAVEGHLAVDHKDLAVVTVVVVRRNNGPDR